MLELGASGPLARQISQNSYLTEKMVLVQTAGNCLFRVMLLITTTTTIESLLRRDSDNYGNYYGGSGCLCVK